MKHTQFFPKSHTFPAQPRYGARHVYTWALLVLGSLPASVLTPTVFFPALCLLLLRASIHSSLISLHSAHFCHGAWGLCILRARFCCPGVVGHFPAFIRESEGAGRARDAACRLHRAFLCWLARCFVCRWQAVSFAGCMELISCGTHSKTVCTSFSSIFLVVCCSMFLTWLAECVSLVHPLNFKGCRYDTSKLL
jgi:hypothetical protein